MKKEGIDKGCQHEFDRDWLDETVSHSRIEFDVKSEVSKFCLSTLTIPSAMLFYFGPSHVPAVVD